MAARGLLTPGGINHFGALLFPLFLSHFFLSLRLPVAALEVGPLNPAREFWERCKLSSGVSGKAPAANDFDAF